MSDARSRHNVTQQRYYAGPPKSRMAPAATPYIRRHVDELVRFASLRPRQRILEVGCGMGRHMLELLRRGFQVEGLDLSPVLLERLRAAASPQRLQLYCADLADPPEVLAGRYDRVIGFFTLHHVHDVGEALRSAYRLLRANGEVAFVEPNAFNPLFYLQILLTPDMSWAGDRGIVQMRPNLLRQQLEDAGFRPRAIRRFGFFPPQLANRSWGPSAEQRLERLRPLGPILPFQLIGGRRVDR